MNAATTEELFGIKPSCEGSTWIEFANTLLVQSVTYQDAFYGEAN